MRWRESQKSISRQQGKPADASLSRIKNAKSINKSRLKDKFFHVIFSACRARERCWRAHNCHYISIWWYAVVNSSPAGRVRAFAHDWFGDLASCEHIASWTTVAPSLLRHALSDTPQLYRHKLFQVCAWIIMATSTQRWDWCWRAPHLDVNCAGVQARPGSGPFEAWCLA